MKCLHCLVEFHAEEIPVTLGQDADGGWIITKYDCPACHRMNLFLVNGKIILYPGGHTIDPKGKMIPVRPKGSSRPPCPQEVPKEICEDYNEACLVLYDSPKASAALSRRCLQNLLRATGKVKLGNLANEIAEIIKAGGLPSYIEETIDSIRVIGNFAAHPIKSDKTGEILPVESGEAEGNLDVLEALFDFYYVQPARIQKRKDALSAKVAEAGKKPTKQAKKPNSSKE